MLEAIDFFEFEATLSPERDYSRNKMTTYKGGLHVYNDNSAVGYFEDNGKITHMIAGVFLPDKGLSLTVYNREGDPVHFHINSSKTIYDGSSWYGKYGEFGYHDYTELGECKTTLKSVLKTPNKKDEIIKKHIDEIKLVENDNIDLFFLLDYELEGIDEKVAKLQNFYNINRNNYPSAAFYQPKRD